MLKTYEITQEGKSNGNIIASPFKIKIITMRYETIASFNNLILTISTCSEFSDNLPNDDIPVNLIFDLPEIGSSKNNDLQETFEIILEEKYSGNWSVFTE